MTKDPVENAIISVYNEKNIVFNAVSDSSGTFKIPIVFYRKASSIKIHVLSYSDFELDIIPKVDTAQQKYYFLGIYKINPKSIELKEVSIKAKRRYSDTTRIDLSKEKFEHSVRNEDLLSSGYGFSKDANGQLYYKGKPISNVLVNGGDFFGKNNLDIYHLLPALTLDNIQVVETNIDSITNITLLRPVVKINLVFKDKYKNGKFGNINLGAGTAQRYLANTNLFSYKKEEQVSLSVNSNNVNTNDNTIQDPRVSFAANGNNVAANSATFTWRNVYANKIQADLSIDGKMGTKNFISEADLQQVSPPLSSHTFNSSNIRSLDINNTEFDIKYRIDSLNNINITQTFDRSRTKERDSLNYNVLLDSLNTISQLDKLRHANTDLLSTKMGYQKKFPGKKGRLLNIDFEMNNNHYTVNEFDNVADLGDQSLKKYFIDGNRSVTEHKYAVNSGFTEPINDDTYIQFLASCRWETMNYSPRINSDRVIVSSDDPSLLTNNYIQSGIKFRKTLNKVSIDATAGGIILLRSIDQPHGNNNASFFNPDLDLRVDYKIRKDKSLVFGYPGVGTPGTDVFASVELQTDNANFTTEPKAGIFTNN